MSFARILFGSVLLFSLAGCNSTDPGVSSKEVLLDPAAKDMKEGSKRVTYVPLDKQTYNIKYTYDAGQLGYDVELSREGAALSADTTDDALVQNTIRDFFQRNICSKGYYPGILGGDTYGPRGSGKWAAKVKCTTKQQQPAVSNVTKKAAPAQKATPAQTTPAQATPAQSTPAQATPAQQTTTQQAPRNQAELLAAQQAASKALAAAQ